MAKPVVLAAAFIVASIGATAGEEPGGNWKTTQAPYISVSSHQAYVESGRVPDSVSALNPHEVVVMVGRSEETKVLLTRYIVVPGEPAEWQSADWQGYEFKILVHLGDQMSFARVIASHNGSRVFESLCHLNLEQPIPDPLDPEQASARLEYLEDQVEYLSDQNQKLHELSQRIRDAQFRPVPDHWLSTNCALEDNQWGIDNDWVTRELDPDLIRAQYPIGIDPASDRQAEEFFNQWHEGDRLFAYGTPSRLQGPLYGEWGYIIVRECRVVAKLSVLIS